LTNRWSPRTTLICLAVAMFLLVAASALVWLQGTSPRSQAICTAFEFATAVQKDSFGSLEHLVYLPSVVSEQSGDERIRFLREVLSNEVSVAGIKALRTNGQFGPLRMIFPEQADRWAKLFQINAEDCVAFKMQRNGITAQLVLVKQKNEFRILRCNNVKQMGDS
jgi:hypothetical protein